MNRIVFIDGVKYCFIYGVSKFDASNYYLALQVNNEGKISAAIKYPKLREMLNIKDDKEFFDVAYNYLTSKHPHIKVR